MSWSLAWCFMHEQVWNTALLAFLRRHRLEMPSLPEEEIQVQCYHCEQGVCTEEVECEFRALVSKAKVNNNNNKKKEKKCESTPKTLFFLFVEWSELEMGKLKYLISS